MNEQPENTITTRERVTDTSTSTMITTPDATPLLTFTIKVMAIVGLIAILSLGAFAVTKVAPLAHDNFLANVVQSITAIFIPSEEQETIEFTIDTHNLDAEKEFVLSFEHTTKRQGTYFFSYTCTDGVSIEVENALGEDEKISCGTSFLITNATKTLPITVTSTKNRFSDISVFITFIPNKQDDASVQGSTILTVTNTKVSSSTSEKEEKPNTGGTGTAVVTPGKSTTETNVISGNTGGGTPTSSSDPNGVADLVVSIIATGVVDKTTNAFTPRLVEENDRAAIRFQVENIGTKVSGAWSFIVDLPLSSGTYVYRPNELQTTLYPGERVEYTLGFDGIDRSTKSAKTVINIDTERAVVETNRANNVAESFITLK